MPGENKKGIRTDRSGVGETAPTGINYLLVIAIDEYERCPALNNCVKDAKDFAQLLWERYQFEECFTTFLFNKDATRSNILEKLAEMEEKVQGQDSLLIYYSGHGETKDNAGYWIPVSGRSEHRFRHEWVSTDELIRHLDAIDSFHTVIIADACFSGSLFAPLQRSGSLGNEQLKSRLGLAASHSRGKALDGTPGENSPFAERLLHNLKENKSAIGFSRLATTVQEEVTKVTEGKQTPVFKPLNVKGDDSGQFVFKLKQDEDTKPSQIIEVQMAPDAVAKIAFEEIEKPLKLLFTAATPDEQRQINTGLESMFVGVIRKYGSGSIKVEQEHGLKFQDFILEVGRHRPHILHFGGHGEAEALILEDRPIGVDTLVALAKNQPTLQLVVLNACNTLPIAKEIAKYVPYVVGTQGPLEDSAAITFANIFYGLLASGNSIEAAFEMGVSAVKSENAAMGTVPVLVFGKRILKDKVLKKKVRNTNNYRRKLYDYLKEIEEEWDTIFGDKKDRVIVQDLLDEFSARVNKELEEDYPDDYLRRINSFMDGAGLAQPKIMTINEKNRLNFNINLKPLHDLFYYPEITKDKERYPISWKKTLIQPFRKIPRDQINNYENFK